MHYLLVAPDLRPRLVQLFAPCPCYGRPWSRILPMRGCPGITMAQAPALFMRSPIPFLALFLSLPFTQAASQAAPAKTPSLRFEDVARQAGLTVAHRSSREQHYIIESMS